MKKIYLSIIGSLMLHLGTEAQWSLSGNAISSGQFLGTTNFQNLVFKAGNARVGVIDVSNNNTGLGVWTVGYPNVTGYQNSGLGNNALANITSAAYANTGVGYLSLTALNNSGNTNTGAGIETLYRNTSGSSNTAGGSLAMYYNTTGSNNNALGVNALQQNTTENYNNVMGSYAAFSTTTQGVDLCAMGHQALYSSSSGFENVAIGTNADYMNTMAFYNIALGSNCMYNNINHISQYGGSNIAIGVSTLYNVGDGFWNTAVGYNSMPVPTYTSSNSINSSAAFGAMTLLNSDATTGGNVALGAFALYSNTSASGQTAIGVSSMFYNTTGYSNTAIGAGAGPGSSYPSLINATAVGYGANNFASNQVVIGNTSMTVTGGYAPSGWTILSDARFKKNIQENVPGLTYIRQLRPVTYNVDVTGLNSYLQPKQPAVQGQSIQPVSESAKVSLQEKEKITCTGFIAQEVEAVNKSMGFDFAAVKKPVDGKGLYGLSYEQFVVPLVKAAQEMSKENDSLETTIAGLQSQINDLKQQISLLSK